MDSETPNSTHLRSPGLGPPRFRESTYLIPTPGLDEEPSREYEPLILKSWVIGTVTVAMIALGIALEVALEISTRHGGFHVPAKNVFKFASTQFLTSFFPTLLVAPLGYLWSVADWMLQWYQPYITLSKGSAPAEESILLDYIALNRFSALMFSFKHRHWFISVSALTAVGVIFLQPLAGSVLQVKPVPHTSDAFASTSSVVGLLPTVGQLNAFLASAGYADAAVYNHLDDPPFVWGGWASEEISLASGDYVNGTLFANITAIRTDVNCANPATVNFSVLYNGNITLTATSTDGCSKNVTLQSTNSAQQFGVTNVENCPNSSTDVAFQPVMFWFFNMGANNKSQVASVFCRPTIEVFNVEATTDLNNGSTTDVTILNNYTIPNNVTGSPLNGRAYNGVVFDHSNDTTVQARATAINSAVPGAIFRSAQQLPGGPQTTFDSADGFLNATNDIYAQHLSLAAKSIYFIPSNGIVPGNVISDVPRLFIEPVPAHILAVLLIIIGLIGVVLHTTHRRVRKRLRLTTPPGSIASIVSLTARSGFGDLILPYDDEEKITRKLQGLTFRLDARTGAIVAEDNWDTPLPTPHDPTSPYYDKVATAEPQSYA